MYSLKTEFFTHAWGPSEVHDAPTILALDSSTLQNLPCLWKTSFRAYFPREAKHRERSKQKEFPRFLWALAQYFSASLKLSLERAEARGGGCSLSGSFGGRPPQTSGDELGETPGCARPGHTWWGWVLGVHSTRGSWWGLDSEWEFWSLTLRLGGLPMEGRR